MLALVVARGDILGDFTEKSDDFARVFVDSGTFGLIPNVPSAYTQPLYGFFLVPIYAIDRVWWLVGGTQILVALGTALVVYLIGQRLGGRRVALAAALVATLHPYLVWHDVHVNREILDQLFGALLVLAMLACVQQPAWWRGALLGATTGVAVLGNSRLVFLPFLIGGYLLVVRGLPAVVPVMAVVAGAIIVVAPWVVRNDAKIGCMAITTDARALWKANNPHTYETLRRGDWIDQVPDPPGSPPSPQDAADIYEATGRIVKVDECAQMRMYQDAVLDFWREHPGEKAKLAGVAAWGLWSPRVGPASDRAYGSGTWLEHARDWVAPAWFMGLLVLAAVGARRVPWSFLALALLLLVYETVMTMVFTGATRYRIAWEFLLALLAAPSIVALWNRARAWVAR